MSQSSIIYDTSSILEILTNGVSLFSNRSAKFKCTLFGLTVSET